ncbi:MAG: response regulator [Chloroflexi bacterium]|nr:response regulator [Chloroflexota bacterium]MDL1885026.1 response regulator [Anaerolineae bacterium CFX8]
MSKQQPVILYVEDEARSRKVMQLIAAGMGISQLILFEDSSDFAARVQALDPQPDVIFLDIHVAPHNGFEMLAMLRQMPRFDTTPVVAVTASVMNEEIQQLGRAGFNGCLAKPIDMDSFPDTVARILTGEAVWRIIG